MCVDLRYKEGFCSFVRMLSTLGKELLNEERHRGALPIEVRILSFPIKPKGGCHDISL